jgi:hypothetical protein
MLRTICIGSSVLIQGVVVKTLPDGKLVVRVDDKLFVGKPVSATRAA